MKNFVPHGDRVILKFTEVKKSELYVKKNGVFVGGEKSDNDKKKYKASVVSFGSGIDPKTVTWKVGDTVLYNEYNCKFFGEGDELYGVVGKDDIWITYED